MKKIVILVSLVFSVFVSNGQCVSTLAGSGVAGFLNATGTAAQFFNPWGVAVDVSGNVYVADVINNRIRKISVSGVVTTLAGSGTLGYLNGSGTTAQFNKPHGVAVDGSGNVYVADGNVRIRKITPSGVVTNFAGTGVQGYLDGIGNSAQFSNPEGIAVDTSGNIYVADSGSNNKIRKITPAGVVTTLAGSTTGFSDGIGSTAQFNAPSGLTVDSSGNVYVADYLNHRIRKISASGIVTTLAGSGVAGYADGAGITAQFNKPNAVSIDSTGDIYVADSVNNRIRKITSTGVVTTLAGSGTAGFADGSGTFAQFNSPFGVCVDTSGNLYIADINNQRIRKISPLTASISYNGNPFCNSITTPQPVTLTGTGAYTGGTFSSSTGYIVNSNTGAINPSTTNPGTYTIRYSSSLSGCSAIATTQVTITGLPTATISYSGSPFCKSLTSVQATLNGTGAYTGGTFTSTTGLSINASTGLINPSLSTAGTYTITYSTPASGGCASISTTKQVTITAVPSASISYSGNPFCQSIGYSPTVTLTGTGFIGGGIYSSTTGLTINSSTGEITPSTSNTGTYTVSYATQSYGGCAAVSTTTLVTITALPTAIISYSGSPFCKSLTSVQATTTGTGAYTGGTYYAGSNLSMNSVTGAINPSLSSAGTYTVYYKTLASGGCQVVTASTSVVILPVTSSSISADGVVGTSTTITNGNAITLKLNGVLSAQPNIQWTPATAISSTNVVDPVVYPSTTTTYTASFVNSNGCTQTTSFTVNVTPQPNIGTLSISSPNATIGLFDTITVNVQLTNATDLYSLYMKLKGNAAVSQYLDYTGYTAGTLFGVSNVISTPPTVTNGVPDFGMTKVGSVPGYAGSGLFYTFTFTPKNIDIPAGTTFCFYLDDVNAYNTSGVACGLTNQGQLCCSFTNQVNVWPGDLNNSKTVTTADLLPIGYFYNSHGSTRPNASIQWTAQPATLWGYNHSSTNGDAYKVFADSNGDGVINNADQAAIGFNMNRIHAKMASPSTIQPTAPSQLTLAGGNLIITPNATVVNSLVPQNITFTVSLSNSGGLSGLYGISVNLLFDENIFDLYTATVDYAGSIFGSPSTDCLVMNFASTNTVSVALTRFANAPINGQGLLFKVTLQTKSPVTSSLSQTPVTGYVDSANTQTGDPIVVQEAPAMNFTVINNLAINTIKAEDFVLYPNPANEVVYLVMGSNAIQANELKIKVFNILGKKIEETLIQSATTELSTKNWGTAGVYFVEVTDTENTVLMTKKVIVNRK